jgi:hypothetical protein
MLAQLSLFSKINPTTTTSTNKKEQNQKNTKETQTKAQTLQLSQPQKTQTQTKETTMNKTPQKEENKPKPKIEVPLEAKTKVITFTPKIKKEGKELNIKDLTIEDIEETTVKTRLENPTEIYYNFYEYKLLFLSKLRQFLLNVADRPYEEICKKLSQELYPMTPKILREMYYIERNSRRRKYLEEVKETLFKILRLSGIARELKENQIILNENGNSEEILKNYEEIRQYLINKYPPEKQKTPITENKFMEALALVVKKYSKKINMLSNFTNKSFYYNNKILQGIITTWSKDATYEIPNLHSASEVLKKINPNSLDIIIWKTKDTEETPAELSEIDGISFILLPSLKGKFSQVVKGNSFNLAIYILSSALKDGGYLVLNHEKEIKKEIFENKKHQYYMIPVVKITNKNHGEEEYPYTTIFIKVSKENLNKVTIPSKAFEIEVDLSNEKSIESVKEQIKKFIKENLESYTDLLTQENEIKKEIIQILQDKVDEIKKTTKLNSHQLLINPLIEKAEKLKMKEFVELAEDIRHKLNESVKSIKNIEPIKTNFSRYIKIRQIKLSSSQILSQDEEQQIKETAKEIAKRLLQETQNNIAIRLLMILQITREIANNRLEIGIFEKGYEERTIAQNSFEFETKDIDKFISEEVVFPINLLNAKNFEELIQEYLLKFKNKEVLITRRSEEMKTFSASKIEKEKVKEFERIMLKIINRSFDTHFTDLKVALEKIARIDSPYKTTKEKIAYAVDITAKEYKVDEKAESAVEALRRRDYSNLIKLAKEICERINNKDEYIKTVIRVKNSKLFNTIKSIKDKLETIKNSMGYENEKVQALKEQIGKVKNKRYKELIKLMEELVKEKEILDKG